MNWPLLLMIPLLAILVGCQSTPSLDGNEDGGNTGELGAPVARTGPGDIYVQLGAAYLAEGNVGEAFKNARKAVLVDPKSSQAHNLLGVLYQRLGNMKLAGDHFRKAVSLDPHDPYSLNALGSYLCLQGNYPEADVYFRRALKNPLYPTPWVALHNAGHCSEQAGKLGVAEADYRAALQKNPEFAVSLLRMGHISFHKANYLSARAYLQRYTEVAGHSAESLWLGVRTEQQLGDLQQVAEYAKRLNAEFPDSEQARLLSEVQR